MAGSERFRDNRTHLGEVCASGAFQRNGVPPAADLCVRIRVEGVRCVHCEDVARRERLGIIDRLKEHDCQGKSSERFGHYLWIRTFLTGVEAVQISRCELKGACCRVPRLVPAFGKRIRSVSKARVVLHLDGELLSLAEEPCLPTKKDLNEQQIVSAPMALTFQSIVSSFSTLLGSVFW